MAVYIDVDDWGRVEILQGVVVGAEAKAVVRVARLASDVAPGK